MSYGNILFDVDNGVATVTLNRPDKLNALNAATIGDLDAVFEVAARDDEIKALIVTGAGGKAFAAGADIGELASASPVEAWAIATRGQNVFRRLESMRKVSVAAISGIAFGGGLELAMCCTVRFAASNAKLGQPEVRLGIPPGYGGTQRLPRLVGRGRALEMLLTGDSIDAQRALEIGLVNLVFAPGELMDESRAWVDKVLANAPVALSLVVEAVDAGLNLGLEDGLRFEAAAFGLAFSTHDRAEGTRAFLEKRKPNFTGN
ncbi:MAG: enoyl-CoA hydratase/isomerase family protein [Acidobacteria bacterium]|nr:enoyl-CoA hydratase/isomerase family protein [Acidobacteriota bacterium]MBI3472977.1 enoyl-CoA hydratase/isomerase family protein [Candidatus Solibacter usitatus]